MHLDLPLPHCTKILKKGVTCDKWEGLRVTRVHVTYHLPLHPFPLLATVIFCVIP